MSYNMAEKVVNQIHLEKSEEKTIQTEHEDQTNKNASTPTHGLISGKKIPGAVKLPFNLPIALVNQSENQAQQNQHQSAETNNSNVQPRSELSSKSKRPISSQLHDLTPASTPIKNQETPGLPNSKPVKKADTKLNTSSDDNLTDVTTKQSEDELGKPSLTQSHQK